MTLEYSGLINYFFRTPVCSDRLRGAHEGTVRDHRQGLVHGAVGDQRQRDRLRPQWSHFWATFLGSIGYKF